MVKLLPNLNAGRAMIVALGVATLAHAAAAQDALPPGDVPELPQAAPPEPAPPDATPPLAGAAQDQAAKLDALFADLADPETKNWQIVEQDIWREWSRSGSAAMDLLLQRGRAAMAADEVPVAIGHLTALTDHAPEFAEGWNALATAYFQAGEFGPSIDAIKHVLALNPRHFGALSGLGSIFESLGYDEDALAAYKAALVIDPHLDGVAEAISRIEKANAGETL